MRADSVHTLLHSRFHAEATISIIMTEIAMDSVTLKNDMTKRIISLAAATYQCLRARGHVFGDGLTVD